MPERTRRANNAKSKIRSRVEYVFADQKTRIGLFVRTIGIARATTKIGLVNLVYDIRRPHFIPRRVAARGRGIAPRNRRASSSPTSTGRPETSVPQLQRRN